MNWVTLGLNSFDEWIQECNGQRRVQTLAGTISEKETPDFRFGRLTSMEDAQSLCKLLSRAHVFQSYKNLLHAYSVWTTGFKKPYKIKNKSDQGYLNFKKEIELRMAERIYEAYSSRVWHHDLPIFENSILRPGVNPWPLGIDLGLISQHHLSFDPTKFNDWRKKENIEVIQNNSGWVLKKNNQVFKVIENNIGNNNDIINFAPPKPHSIKQDIWTTAYTPFSSPSSSPTGYVPPLLHQALKTRMKGVSFSKMKEDVKNALGVASEENLKTFLSDDQIDAVWFALQKMQSKEAFLLADETGYGKGRVLAALSSIALRQNIQVLFITEKKGLFSDFYRDCSAVFHSSLPHLSILQTKTPLLSPSGDRVEANFLKEASNEKWIWTTYSQFSNNNKSRIDSVLEWMKKPTWVILDEAQNAAGQSNTFEVIEKFTKKSQAVLFSSATFAKNENQLAAYKKISKYSSSQWKRLQAAFGQSDTVRSALSIDWAKNGYFLRRQHPPQALPDELWISNSFSEKYQEIFSAWWQNMYLLAEAWGKEKRVSSWSIIGSMMSRAQREFAILQKTSSLAQVVENDIKNNRKSVIVSDWTLSSHVSRLIKKTTLDASDDDVEELSLKESVLFNQKPTWKESWSETVNDVFDTSVLDFVPHERRSKIETLKKNVIVELNKLPDWSISPFDDLISLLHQKGISVGEISGRNWSLIQTDEKQWEIKPIKNKSRPEIISDFNNGLLDVALLTRAGNSGVSLHSSASFKNQQQRHLIEWDISPDPSVRTQFWGRVRRKDQMNEPVRSTLLVDTPFERRNQSLHQQKQKKLLSHTGEDVSPHTQTFEKMICTQWAMENPKAAKVIDPLEERISSQMLLRSVILNSSDQQSLMQSYKQGLELCSELIERHPVWNDVSRIHRSLWFWGNGEDNLVWEERFWPMQPTAHHENFSSAVTMEMMDWQEALNLLPTSYQKTNILQASLGKQQGVLVNDPKTGQRVRAVILGYSPTGKISTPATLSVSLLLTSSPTPLKTSLLSLVSKEVLNVQPLKVPAQSHWFDGQPSSVHCMVLTGPAWSVAAWGERNAPFGELCHLLNEDGSSSWGWRMPQQWKYDDILQLPKELASPQHAYAFLSSFPEASMVWVWSPTETIELSSQSNGLLIKASPEVFNEKIPFPMMRKMRTLSSTPTFKTALIGWGDASKALHSWFGQGGCPTISATYQKWHQKTWAQYAPKK